MIIEYRGSKDEFINGLFLRVGRNEFTEGQWQKLKNNRWVMRLMEIGLVSIFNGHKTKERKEKKILPYIEAEEENEECGHKNKNESNR